MEGNILERMGDILERMHSFSTDWPDELGLRGMKCSKSEKRATNCVGLLFFHVSDVLLILMVLGSYYQVMFKRVTKQLCEKR